MDTEDPEHREPRPDQGTEAERKQQEDDEETGGFNLRGPLGFGAEFPRSSAEESKWIIRAIALAIPILALLYGLSFVLSLLLMWVISYGTICPIPPSPDRVSSVFSDRDGSD